MKFFTQLFARKKRYNVSISFQGGAGAGAQVEARTPQAALDEFLSGNTLTFTVVRVSLDGVVVLTQFERDSERQKAE